MYLASVRVRNLGPFDDVTLPFVDAEGAPRLTTVVLGDSGAGKTTLLAAIACTRPGLAITPPRARDGVPASSAFAACRYRLGEDDPARPHDLVVASPAAELEELPNETLARRREQAHFDKLAQERGFCVISLSAARWAARSPSIGVTPDRGVAGLDQRSLSTFDDATRADLCRELKQSLVSAVTVAALTSLQAQGMARLRDSSIPAPPPRTSPAMLEQYRATFATLLPDGEVSFEGVDPNGYEPLFRDASGRLLPFDELSFGIKNRLIIGGILLRRLALAYPGRDPRNCEGIALIDELEAHLPQRRQREIVDVLRRAFPRLQLIITTQSPLLLEGRAHDEVIVLSRDLEGGGIEVSGGPAAVLH
jgi:energy-coupling factor transporter ATP-binding protein EcfA2